MTANRFDIDNSLAIEFRAALCGSGNRKQRELLRKIALHILQLTHQRGLSYDGDTFFNILSGIKHNLTADQQSLVMGMCQDASPAYEQWRTEKETEAYPGQPGEDTDHYDVSELHGGSGYTGRLPIGIFAPYGSESFQSDDEPRTGRAYWVKAVTAGGNGAGYSLAELSSRRQRKRYAAVLPSEELRDMPRQRLLSLMDTATNPGNFLRAMLVYYGQPLNFFIGNVRINSGTMNNPENRKSACQLDSVYRFMKEIDKNGIITPERATRFLVLCNDLLLQVKVSAPRNKDRLLKELYEERKREVRMAREDIMGGLKRAAAESGITALVMRDRIKSDARSSRTAGWRTPQADENIPLADFIFEKD